MSSSDKGSVMGQEWEMFAAELRRLGALTGLSLGKLAQAAHVNRGYIGHVEHGQRWPSRSVAAALDDTLGARGTLLAAWEGADAAATPAPSDPDEFERFERHWPILDRRMLAEQRRAEDALGRGGCCLRCSHTST